MIVLLPPSEGKAPGGEGPPLDLTALSLTELTAAREQVVDALAGLCAADADKAAAVLGLGRTQAGEVARNGALREAPTLPAGLRYTGVLFDALGLTATEVATLGDRLLIFSGLWGVLRPGDPIPAYRCPIGTALPGLGGLAAHWRSALATALDAATVGRLVVDLRSSAYAAVWRPAAATLAVRVLHERTVHGRVVRGVVSHHNKATKGRLARSLLGCATPPRTPAEAAEALRADADALGWTLEPHIPARQGAPWRLDVVVRDL